MGVFHVVTHVISMDISYSMFQADFMIAIMGYTQIYLSEGFQLGYATT